MFLIDFSLLFPKKQLCSNHSHLWPPSPTQVLCPSLLSYRAPEMMMIRLASQKPPSDVQSFSTVFYQRQRRLPVNHLSSPAICFQLSNPISSLPSELRLEATGRVSGCDGLRGSPPRDSNCFCRSFRTSERLSLKSIRTKNYLLAKGHHPKHQTEAPNNLVCSLVLWRMNMPWSEVYFPRCHASRAATQTRQPVLHFLLKFRILLTPKDKAASLWCLLVLKETGFQTTFAPERKVRCLSQLGLSSLDSILIDARIFENSFLSFCRKKLNYIMIYGFWILGFEYPGNQKHNSWVCQK